MNRDTFEGYHQSPCLVAEYRDVEIVHRSNGCCVDVAVKLSEFCQKCLSLPVLLPKRWNTSEHVIDSKRERGHSVPALAWKVWSF